MFKRMYVSAKCAYNSLVIASIDFRLCPLVKLMTFMLTAVLCLGLSYWKSVAYSGFQLGGGELVRNFGDFFSHHSSSNARQGAPAVAEKELRYFPFANHLRMPLFRMFQTYVRHCV